MAWQGHAALLCLQQELCTQQESLGARAMLEFRLMNPFVLDHGFSPSPRCEPAREVLLCLSSVFPPSQHRRAQVAPSRRHIPECRCPCLALGALSQPGSSSGSRAEAAGAAG